MEWMDRRRDKNKVARIILQETVLFKEEKQAQGTGRKKRESAEKTINDTEVILKNIKITKSNGITRDGMRVTSPNLVKGKQIHKNHSFSSWKILSRSEIGTLKASEME